MASLPSRLSITSDSDGTAFVVGVIDMHTAESLADHLASMGSDSSVVLDLSGVDFVDSAGLRTILVAHRALADVGQRLELANVSSAVGRLLEITGLDDHLDVS